MRLVDYKNIKTTYSGTLLKNGNVFILSIPIENYNPYTYTINSTSEVQFLLNDVNSRINTVPSGYKSKFEDAKESLELLLTDMEAL